MNYLYKLYQYSSNVNIMSCLFSLSTDRHTYTQLPRFTEPFKNELRERGVKMVEKP